MRGSLKGQCCKRRPYKDKACRLVQGWPLVRSSPLLKITHTYSSTGAEKEVGVLRVGGLKGETHGSLLALGLAIMV